MEIFTLGERLMVYRTRAGLSKKELAERVGVSAATITKYEKDAPNPNEDILSKMAMVLNVSVNKILFGFDDPAKEQEQNSLLKNRG